MIHSELLQDQGILVITPEGPLQESDFVNLAQLVDLFIEAEGGNCQCSCRLDG